MIQHGDHTELQDEGQHDLLGFWSAVEELRRADRTLWHQLATEIFYGYVNKPTDDGAGVQGGSNAFPVTISYQVISFI